MNRVWSLLTILCALLISSSGASPAGTAPDKAHQLAQAASQISPDKCNSVHTMEDCHGLFPSGCTAAGHYDAYLSFLKNQRPSPLAHSTGLLTADDFDNKEANIPDGLASTNHADHATELADLAEGNIFTLIGYLYHVKETGSEACNCQLTAKNAIDWHMWVGFDADQAQRVLNGEIKTAAKRKPLLQEAIVAEISPHYRAEERPEWTLAKVKAVLGKQVKLVGQLLIDNDHVKPSDDCGNAGANLNNVGDARYGSFIL